jgi:hypothetical protein
MTGSGWWLGGNVDGDRWSLLLYAPVAEVDFGDSGNSVVVELSDRPVLCLALRWSHGRYLWGYGGMGGGDRAMYLVFALLAKFLALQPTK